MVPRAAGRCWSGSAGAGDACRARAARHATERVRRTTWPGTIAACARSLWPRFDAGAPSSVEVGKGDTKLCGRMTQASTTQWEVASEFDGLKVRIDSSFCSFAADSAATSYPDGSTNVQYVASIVGDMRHLAELGTITINHAHSRSFELHMLHPSVRGSMLYQAAKNFRWVVSWLAGAGPNTGITKRGATGWKLLPASRRDKAVRGAHADRGDAKATILYLDVNTAACKFKGTPRYFTALRGLGTSQGGWRDEGSHIVYKPRPTGFRVYITYQMPIKPADAERDGWRLSFIGVSRNTEDEGAAYWQSGTVKPHWTMAAHHAALAMHVSTKSSGFIKVPAYVTAIEVTGGSDVDVVCSF